MQKRWCLRKDTDIKKFADAAKAAKEFTPERQQEMMKLIFACKMDKWIANGVKKKRARKKIIKKELAGHKEDLVFTMLDMMEERIVDVRISREQDRANSKASFDALIRISEGEKYE